MLGDAVDHRRHAPVPHAPRHMLQRQVDRLAEAGFTACMTSELEFVLFRGIADEIRRLPRSRADLGLQRGRPYLQTTKEEAILRPLRNHLVGAGIPVERTKGEAETWQAELNIRWGEGVTATDYHTIAKHAAREIAGRRDGELPAELVLRQRRKRQPHPPALSRDGAPAFHDAGAEHELSETSRALLAGLLRRAPEFT